jgi:hypothetical protein
MRILPLTLPLVALLACQGTARIATDAKPTGGPSVTPPPPPPATTAPAARPPRPTTKAGCDACGGLFAVHGIEQKEVCICKTKDAGKACKDGKDCEGSCIVQEDAKFEVVEPGPPPRGFYTGRCADYDTTFGCHLSIVNGARANGPVPAEEAAHRFCVD